MEEYGIPFSAIIDPPGKLTWIKLREKSIFSMLEVVMMIFLGLSIFRVLIVNGVIVFIKRRALLYTKYTTAPDKVSYVT